MITLPMNVYGKSFQFHINMESVSLTAVFSRAVFLVFGMYSVPLSHPTHDNAMDWDLGPRSQN